MLPMNSHAPGLGDKMLGKIKSMESKWETKSIKSKKKKRGKDTMDALRVASKRGQLQ